ncbi:Zinc phosphodiesterase ELAC protein 2 [Nosema bombycis CQ1]|uniref:ribonuclease Z n=1 Tax=Nosema bombycis (strain CQ1 / CVCC 102059) TaxID=578461 RepID=R0MK86_NOSB1|nr:Zinc phosphodiesterase ELAC protein 2 [Nosema bombycis CQ1]|eukprot:EOB13208.1 Zinc phosphodiesterase ELAC protein 2 [Nosema bombycis CQ1]
MRTCSKTKESDCGKGKRKKKENGLVKNILINHKNKIIKKLQGLCINSGDEIIFKNGFKIKSVKSKKYVQVKNELINNSLTFLGTGCALPSKYRNVSSVLYNIEDTLILFDVGEDTFSQLNRIYGHLDILKKIKFIFISHSHADHCLGIINLLKVIKHNVVVIAPNALIDFLSIYNYKNVEFYDTTPTKEVEPKFNEFFNTSQKCCKSNLDNIVKELGGLENVYETIMRDYVFKIEVGDFIFNVCGVEHNLDSCSVSLVYKNKIKISYSGDTRPSFIFAIMSKDSDALIHESTFNGNNLDKAIKTKHSTVQEANIIYEFSKSKTLFLTHFSQRYPKGFITIYRGIPCMDFYRYVLNESTFDKNKINNFLKTLDF